MWRGLRCRPWRVSARLRPPPPFYRFSSVPAIKGISQKVLTDPLQSMKADSIITLPYMLKCRPVLRMR